MSLADNRNKRGRRVTHPLLYAIPAAVSASFAFMLPVATPPNAIVYGTDMIRMRDMAVAGIVMNVICIVLTMISITTWGRAIFKLDWIDDAWLQLAPACDFANKTHCCNYTEVFCVMEK